MTTRPALLIYSNGDLQVRHDAPPGGRFDHPYWVHLAEPVPLTAATPGVVYSPLTDAPTVRTFARQGSAGPYTLWTEVDL